MELMIALSIMCLLMAMVIPAVMNARESATDTLCKTRLRELALTATLYAMNSGHYPWGSVDPGAHDKNYFCAEELGKTVYPSEQWEANNIATWEEYQSYCWDFRKKKGQVGWDAGVMFDNKGVDSVQGCPKCSRESDNWNGAHVTGYNYNVAYVGYVEGDAGSRKYPAKYGEFEYPSRVVAFGDGGYAGGVNKFMRAPKQYEGDKSSASLRKAGTQAFRHGSGRYRHCNMAFLDGHVEGFYTPYKTNGKEGWVDEQTRTAFISSGNGIYGPRGWGEPDDFTENKK